MNRRLTIGGTIGLVTLVFTLAACGAGDNVASPTATTTVIATPISDASSSVATPTNFTISTSIPNTATPTFVPTATFSPIPTLPSATPTEVEFRLVQVVVAGSGYAGTMMYEQPSKNAKLVARLNDGLEVIVIASQPPVEAEGIEWLPMYLPGGIDGWADARYIRIIEPSPTP